jgi:methionyl-tRNA formyltransferase
MINKIIFAGTPTIAATTLEHLIQAGLTFIACYTQPDRPKGRGQKLTFSPVKQTSLLYNIPVFQPDNLKNLEHIHQLKQLSPDLIIVFAYGLILPKEILDIPKLGCINIHTSLLPKWRGAAPTQHAVLAGDTTTGISIIQMDPGLDTGPVLHCIPCSIALQDTNKSLLDKLQPLAVTAVLKVLNLINTNQLTPVAQNHKTASYAHKIHKNQAKLNWQLPALELERRIRAFNPEPIAFTHLNTGEQLIENIKILKAAVKQEPIDFKTKNFLPPGSIINISTNNIEVATIKDILQIELLQFPGGKIQSVNNLLNSEKYKKWFNLNAKFY